MLLLRNLPRGVTVMLYYFCYHFTNSDLTQCFLTCPPCVVNMYTLLPRLRQDGSANAKDVGHCEPRYKGAVEACRMNLMFWHAFVQAVAVGVDDFLWYVCGREYVTLVIIHGSCIGV